MSNNKQSSIEFLLTELDIPKLISREKLIMAAEVVRQAKEIHKKEIYQHAINFYLFVENDEVTDQKVEIIENLYKDYLKQFYNETFGK
jgi:hypothetical protein